MSTSIQGESVSLKAAPVTAVPAPAEQESLAQYTSRLSLRFAVPSGLLIGLLIVILNWQRNPVPMLGDQRAFATLTFYALVPIALAVATAGYILGAKRWNALVRPQYERPVGWPAVPIGMAYVMLIAFIAALVLLLVEHAFRDLALAKLQAAVIAGAIGAALIHWVAGQAMRMSVGKLVELTFVVIGIGVYLTAATIDDPLWWQVSFSYLGTMKSSARTIFNFTLALTGLLILIWLPYFMSELNILVRHGLADPRSIRIYRIAFIWLGIAIAFVGIFKSGYTPFTSFMHNWSAYSLAAVFAVMMLGLPKLVPGLPRELFALSWGLMGALVITLLLAAVGYFNTVGLEMIVFALGLTWLSSFISNVSSLAQNVEPDAYPA